LFNKAQYQHEWYLRNKEKACQRTHEWCIKNAERKKAYDRDYYQTHKEQHNACCHQYFLNHQEAHRKLRIDALNHYSEGAMKCAKCGFDDIRALSIDHMNGGGNEHRKKCGNFYTWLRNNNYPEGFQVLCMNCQFIKKQENREFGKRGSNKIQT